MFIDVMLFLMLILVVGTFCCILGVAFAFVICEYCLDLEG